MCYIYNTESLIFTVPKLFNLYQIRFGYHCIGCHLGLKPELFITNKVDLLVKVSVRQSMLMHQDVVCQQFEAWQDTSKRVIILGYSCSQKFPHQRCLILVTYSLIKHIGLLIKRSHYQIKCESLFHQEGY